MPPRDSFTTRPLYLQKELAARGHKVKVVGNWAHGIVMAAQFGPEPGTLCAGVSPRGNSGYVSGD